MKIIKMNETNFSFDSGANLKVPVSKDITLIISNAELIEAAKMVLSEAQRKQKIPDSVVNKIGRKFKAAQRKKGRPRGKKPDELAGKGSAKPTKKNDQKGLF